MAWQFKVTTPTGGERLFAKMAEGVGAFCFLWNIGPPIVNIVRYHIMGVAGNITVRPKQSGRTFQVQFLYCDTTPEGVYASYVIDSERWSGEAATLTDPANLAYTNCNLIPGSMRVVRMGTDGKGHAELVAEAQFNQDGG